MKTSFLWKLWKLQSSPHDSNPMASAEGGSINHLNPPTNLFLIIFLQMTPPAPVRSGSVAFRLRYSRPREPCLKIATWRSIADAVWRSPPEDRSLPEDRCRATWWATAAAPCRSKANAQTNAGPMQDLHFSLANAQNKNREKTSICPARFLDSR
jgi:hypothetical protein